MATSRYSSLWDRWRGDSSGLSETAWAAWLAENYPASVARSGDEYIEPSGVPRSWHICPAVLGNAIWAHFRDLIPGATAGARAIEIQRRFALSNHELAQLGDVRDWITAGGGAAAQQARWMDVMCLMAEVELRLRTDKAAIYALLGIRDDSASG